MNLQRAEIKQPIRTRFSNIAQSPDSEQVFPVGGKSAKALGYDPNEINNIPVEANESFCGVGNPLSLGSITPGQTVLDLGCGAGLDSFLGARRVGQSGTVIGIDMTPEMLHRVNRNSVSAGVTNIEFHLAEADELPVEDETVDVVITKPR